MKKLVFKRSEQKRKDVPVSMRLTSDENEFIEGLVSKLQFRNKKELFLYSTEIIDKFYDWHTADKKFYVGDISQETIDQIEIEFTP